MQSQPPSTSPARDVAVGCGMTIVLHVIAIMLLSAFIYVDNTMSNGAIFAMFAILMLGVSQVVYMGPAIYVAYRLGRPNVGKGLIIGAAITLALTAACWAIINPFSAGGFK